jgi:hypothetical protein
MVCKTGLPKSEVLKMTRLFAASALALAMILPRFAFAEVPSGSVRIEVEANVLKFNIGGWNPAGPEDWRVKSLRAGIGNPDVLAGLGITVVDALTIGIRFGIAVEDLEVKFDEEDSGNATSNTDFDAMKYTMFRWGAIPYLEYAFLDRVVRPFIMVALGFEGNIGENAVEKITFWDFVFGLGGGLHLFGGPSVSVDLTLLFGFSAGGGGTELVDPPDDDGGKERFTRILFRLTGGLGVSGWF